MEKQQTVYTQKVKDHISLTEEQTIRDITLGIEEVGETVNGY
jgi:hypothetical protein